VKPNESCRLGLRSSNTVRPPYSSLRATLSATYSSNVGPSAADSMRRASASSRLMAASRSLLPSRAASTARRMTAIV